MSDRSSSPPDAGTLRLAALSYLARYASTEAGLRRVLNRKIDKWAKAQGEPDRMALATARGLVRDIAAQFVQSGVINDALFAKTRARSSIRGGQSARAVQARLIGKGIKPETARCAVSDNPDVELAAALVLIRRKRMGPYRSGSEAGAPVTVKGLGQLARAGFSRDTAMRALRMEAEEADRRIQDLRSLSDEAFASSDEPVADKDRNCQSGDNGGSQ